MSFRERIEKLKPFFLKYGGLLWTILLYAVSVPALAWSAGVIDYLVLPGRLPYRGVVSFVIPLMLFTLIVFRRKNRYFLPSAVACFLILCGYYAGFQPRTDRNWEPSYRYQPLAKIKGDHVTIFHFRDFRYRTETDFEERWITREFDLNRLENVDLGVCHWDGMILIAHTMLSFRFSDGNNVVFSVETRHPAGAPSGIFPGLFKQFELAYILGSEEDLFKLRTNYRHEQLLLYPTNTSKEDARKLFLDVLARANRIHHTPEFYHTLTQNCTSTLIPSLKKIYPLMRLDLRVLANGLSDQMAYRYGWLDIPPRYIQANGRINRDHYLCNRFVQHLKNPEPYSVLIRQSF